MSESTISTGPAAADRRPVHHFTPAQGWLNDPHGVVHHDGEYHLFHQAIPDEVIWTPRISWGHATSPDLVTWTRHSTALDPAPDEAGCWTGTLCQPPDGPPLILYTSPSPPDFAVAQVRAASPSDGEWQRWTNGDRVELPLDRRTRNRLAMFRDPSVRWEDDRWRMVVGAGYSDGRPAVLSWTSKDLVTWAFDGEVVVGTPNGSGPWLGTGWECPHLVRVDGHDVAIVASWDGVAEGEVLASVGQLRDGRLEGTQWRQITHGGGHYAATTFEDADGVPCLIFWIRGVADIDAGWAGALSIPYRLSVVDGILHLEPHPNVVTAFEADTSEPSRILLTGDDVDGLRGSGIEVERTADELTVTVSSTRLRIPLVPGDPQGPLTVLVDGSIVEVCTGTAVAGAQLSSPPETA